MNVVQSFKQGAKHIAKGQPCEDRTYYLSSNGVDVIALADGAGNQKYTHSAEGAECVTKTICKFFCNNFDKFYEETDEETLKSVIVAVCQKKLSELADKLNLDSIIRLSSTLLVIAVKDDKAIACHLGDGVIGKFSPDGVAVISAPDNGEFASTTYFISYPDANSHMNLVKFKTDNIYSFFLMSDGATEYIYNDTDKSFQDAAWKMAILPMQKNGQEELEKIIQKYMIESDEASDDCSYICLSMVDMLEEEPECEIDNKNEKSRSDLDKNDYLQELIDFFSVKNENNKNNITVDNRRKLRYDNSKMLPIIKLIVLFSVLACIIAFVVGTVKHKSDNTDMCSTVNTSDTMNTIVPYDKIITISTEQEENGIRHYEFERMTSTERDITKMVGDRDAHSNEKFSTTDSANGNLLR